MRWHSGGTELNLPRVEAGLVQKSMRSWTGCSEARDGLAS
jgi:hypothetical protein